MPKEWSQWVANAFAEANPDLKKLYGTNKKALQKYFLQNAKKESRPQKPANWAVPNSLIPEEIRPLDDERYNDMVAKRPQWKNIILPHLWGIGDLTINLGRLYERLAHDKTPMTPEEYIQADRIVGGLEKNLKENRHFWIDYTRNFNGYAPSSQSYNTAPNVFPAHKEFYNAGGTHSRTVSGTWARFKKGRESYAETHHNYGEMYIPKIVEAFKKRSTLEEQWKRESEQAVRKTAEQAVRKTAEQAARVQLEAQKASYEKDAAFKKAEFEKALAAQKASSESVMKQMLANFEAQKNNIRTDTERSHQEMLAQHTAELQRQRGAYESRLSASAAELQKQKIMFEDQLTARTIELERQRASYEAQLAARAAEEAKRKQDAEAFQSQLRRKLNIYERGRVGFNFVGTNTPNTQIKGTKVGATKGGRYVAGRIRYDKNGMAVYDTNEGTPDLFLQMIGIAKKMRK